MDYAEVPIAEAYELLNAGGIVLVCCTKSPGGRYDVAPIAWNCPLDYAPASRLILVCDTGHRSYEDLERSGEFAVALPTIAQRDLVEKAGSVSGRDLDKYSSLGLEYFAASRVDARIPAGVAGCSSAASCASSSKERPHDRHGRGALRLGPSRRLEGTAPLRPRGR